MLFLIKCKIWIANNDSAICMTYLTNRIKNAKTSKKFRRSFSEKKVWNKRKNLELEMLNISIYFWLRSRIKEITVLKQTECQYNFTDASKRYKNMYFDDTIINKEYILIYILNDDCTGLSSLTFTQNT